MPVKGKWLSTGEFTFQSPGVHSYHHTLTRSRDRSGSCYTAETMMADLVANKVIYRTYEGVTIVLDEKTVALDFGTSVRRYPFPARR